MRFLSELKTELVRIVGADRVSDDPLELECYSRPWASPTIPKLPSIIVRPTNVEQVSAIVRSANRLRAPVTAFGGMSNCVGTWPEGTIAVDMLDLNKTIDIDEESMTVTAQAGKVWGELLYEIGKKGWTTGFQMHSWKTATLGGSIALCANAATGAGFGLIGEQVLAVEVVLPNGGIIRTGSWANPSAKKFQRYCYGSDLTGLFIGSHGIFGIITGAAFKMYPLPEARAYYGYLFDTIEQAAQAEYELQRRKIPIESMYMRGPREVLQSLDPSFDGDAALQPIVVFGEEDVVDFYSKKMEEICEDEGGKQIMAERMSLGEEGWWRVPPRLAEQTVRKDGEYVNMSVPFCSNIPTLNVPKVYRALRKMFEEEEAEKYKVYPSGFSTHACKHGDVTFSAGFSFDDRDPTSAQKGREIIERYFDIGTDLGLAPHYIGYTRQNVIMWKLGGTNQLLRAIKKTLDPNNIMNPGQLLTPES